MRRHSKSLWEKRLFAAAVSAAFGTVCTGCCLLLFSALVYFFMDDLRSADLFTSAALVIGGLAGAYLCGKYRRSRGLAEGMVCGAVIYAELAVCGVCVCGTLPGIGKLLLLICAGAVGGVSGVNSKRPKNAADS